MDRVVVVGAGVGGLAAAIELARAGAEVTVLERAARAGGKLREAEVGGRSVDVGPTVLTMRWAWEGLANVEVTRAESVARHAWDDGATLELFADRERSADAVGRFAGADEARAYLAFADYAARIYETVRAPFLESDRPTPLALLRGAAMLARIDAHRTMARALRAFFRDPRLVQLFGRYATYCGSSPYEAPATLNLVSHVERDGVWLVSGGMYRFCEALVARAEALGVRFVYGAHVDEVRVRDGRAQGVSAGGATWSADAVVLNADVAALAAGRFGREASRGVRTGGPRSLSALTWAIAGARGALARHNVFFSHDYAEEHADLFRRRTLPRDPTVYVCAQDKDDRGDDVGDGGRLFVIVNAPARGDEPPDEAEVEACERATFERLRRHGIERQGCAVTRTSPQDFEVAFPATGGALYGAASHGMTSALARPSSRTKTARLYLAGGSVHPGAGVPMAALSGRLAARAVLSDLASTRRSRMAATPGSTSTG